MARRLLCAVSGLLLVSIAAVTPISANAKTRVPNAKWDFLVYMDADNNLQAYADLNLLQMENVGSTADVNIIVLYDRFSGDDGLYKVGKGTLTRDSRWPLTGELNMGSRDTMTTFLTYALNNYPAQHVFLDLWDHGNDFVGTCIDLNPGTSASSSYLYHYQLVQALTSAEAQTGQQIDILAFDGCLQGVAEVAYDYKDLAGYLVASEGYVLLDGFPYDRILNTLIANSGISPCDFAGAVVDRYVDSYAAKADFATLSRIDLGQVDNLASDIKSLVATLESNVDTYRTAILSGRAHGILPWSEYGWDAIVDLYSVVDTTGVGGAVLTDISNAVYVKATSKFAKGNVHGLGVFFPPSAAAMTNDRGLDGNFYKNSAWVPFASDTGWLAFLLSYYNAR